RCSNTTIGVCAELPCRFVRCQRKIPTACSGGSNPVSGRSLRKTGIFADSAGDFWAFGHAKQRNESVETERESAKARYWRAFLRLCRENLPSADCLAGAGGIEPPNGGTKIC